MPLFENWPSDQSRGFALLLVLWVFALLSLIGLRVASSARADLQLATNLVAGAEAETLVDAGFAATVARLLNTPDEALPALLGAPLAQNIPGGAVQVLVTSEAGKLNPSFASERLVAAFLEACGMGPGDARQLAAAIADWVDQDKTARPEGAEAEAYMDLGVGYAPPNAPFATIEELMQVRGMTPEIFAAIRPWITVYGSNAQPDPLFAEGPVAAALASTTEQPGGMPGTEPHSGPTEPAQPTTAQQAQPATAQQGGQLGAGAGTVFDIDIDARTDAGAHAHTRAIVEVGIAVPGGMRTLDWRSF